ncbi:DUF2970 domain-containing protein [Marinobacter daepoensis]|uniref:DUF2970 domain-containing protein n=1 Tax=Marinobacter daepoensis TaxID=262077 RepID=A0ABS3BDL3_9GAMM|nr:DUF2970 domain-containing protein [Marinobacter daepoensis]MBN7768981.1 DUF2970 domain-containing protein [Marinobacter daepoensis]MBY6032414.1 DUF2970 domain-containing protein [Marinobacter daepoensis]MBY6077671.1 DUF2970 domain-containing protein [Marinobacter daepoensis]
MSDTTDNNNRHQQPPRTPGVLRIMQSILAGAFGVQSDKRRREDFSHHSPWPYIIAGILFTTGFVGALILVVQVVLSGQ